MKERCTEIKICLQLINLFIRVYLQTIYSKKFGTNALFESLIEIYKILFLRTGENIVAVETMYIQQTDTCYRKQCGV